MAQKKAIAQTRIVHGKGDERVVINEGDEVKGLDRETLRDLIDAGSVRIADTDEEPVRRGDAPPEDGDNEPLENQIVRLGVDRVGTQGQTDPKKGQEEGAAQDDEDESEGDKE